MGKTKMTLDEAVAAKETKLAELKEAKANLNEFKKENKIKGDAEPEGEKLQKKYTKLQAAVETTQEELDAIKETVKELKPAKVRESKYEYPEGLDAKEKKKFRTAARAAAKKAEKPAKEAKKEKVEKEEKKADKKSKRKDEED